MDERVNEVIGQYVRPYLWEHGGDIEVLDTTGNVVKVRLTGNCSGCPAANLTVEGIVKSQLMSRISDIKDVEVETQIDPDLINFAKKILNKTVENDGAYRA